MNPRTIPLQLWQRITPASTVPNKIKAALYLVYHLFKARTIKHRHCFQSKRISPVSNRHSIINPCTIASDCRITNLRLCCSTQETNRISMSHSLFALPELTSTHTAFNMKERIIRNLCTSPLHSILTPRIESSQPSER
jgi:hypothetical protein